VGGERHRLATHTRLRRAEHARHDAAACRRGRAPQRRKGQLQPAEIGPLAPGGVRRDSPRDRKGSIRVDSSGFMRNSAHIAITPQSALQSEKPRTAGASRKRGTEESNLALRFWRPPCYRYTSPPGGLRIVRSDLSRLPGGCPVGARGTSRPTRFLAVPAERPYSTRRMEDEQAQAAHSACRRGCRRIRNPSCINAHFLYDDSN
jgi:hypothetical protein